MKVLLSSYACEPGLGSEPGVGWNTAMALSKLHEVWVVTYARHADGILRSVGSDDTAQRIHFEFVDVPWPLRLINRNWKGIGVQIHYYVWQYVAYLRARKLHRRLRFDVVQHVTYVKYWQPSFMGRLGPPFLMGPVAGAEQTRLEPGLVGGVGPLIYEVIRRVARHIGELDPFVREAIRSADIIVAATPESRARLQALGGHDVRLRSQVALEDTDLSRATDAVVASTRRPGLVRFLSVGSMTHIKGFHLSLRAFSRLTEVDAEYAIIGDGPYRRVLETLVRRYELEGRVQLLGAMARSEVLEEIRSADVVLVPSLHDSGSFVCAEAMAAGRAIIALKQGGPAVLLRDDCGVLIEVASASQVVEDLSTEMSSLAMDPQRCAGLGSRARLRAETELSLNATAAAIDLLYHEMVAR